MIAGFPWAIRTASGLGNGTSRWPLTTGEWAAFIEIVLENSLLLLTARRYRGNRNRIAGHVASQTDSLPGVFRKGGKILVRDVVNLPAGNKYEFTAALDAGQRAIPVGHLSVLVLLHHFCVAGTARAIADHAAHRHIGSASQ